MLHNISEERETGQVILGLLLFFYIYGWTVCVNFGMLIGATFIPIPTFTPADVLKTISKKAVA